MKKLTAFLVALFLIVSTVSFAQTKIAPQKAKTEQKAKTQKVEKKHEEKVKTDNNATHFKKDGTADKRYKKQATHVKKDGTPDKRYKENK